MNNIVWLKPNKKNTKYHAFHVSSNNVLGTKIYDIISMCNCHSLIYSDNEKGYQLFKDNYLTVKDMGISERDLTNNFKQHCCKKCLISYNHRNKQSI